METLKPKFVITYEGADVSGDFDPILNDITFRDYLDGKASDISLSLSNREGYFFGDWYPTVNDKLNVLLGYANGEMIDAGDFFVDETELSGGNAGDTFTLRAMSLQASFINSSVKRVYYDNKPILDIATTIADAMGCRITGELSGNYTGHQNETDLVFLGRIARENGRILKVEGNTIIIYQRNKLGTSMALVLKKDDVLSYRISDIASGRLSSATVKWWNRKDKKMIEGTYESNIKDGGSVIKWEEVQSPEDAKKRAEDIIVERNKRGVAFSCETLGDTRLRSGVAIELQGFGRFDNTYYIAEATHKISRQGYTTSIILNKND